MGGRKKRRRKRNREKGGGDRRNLYLSKFLAHGRGGGGNVCLAELICSEGREER